MVRGGSAARERMTAVAQLRGVRADNAAARVGGPVQSRPVGPLTRPEQRQVNEFLRNRVGPRPPRPSLANAPNDHFGFNAWRDTKNQANAQQRAADKQAMGGWKFPPAGPSRPGSPQAGPSRPLPSQPRPQSGSSRPSQITIPSFDDSYRPRARLDFGNQGNQGSLEFPAIPTKDKGKGRAE